MSRDFRALEEEYTLLHMNRPEHVPPFVRGHLRFMGDAWIPFVQGHLRNVTDAWIYVVKNMYEAQLRVKGKGKAKL